MTRLRPIPASLRPVLARAWSGWTAVVLVCLAVLVLWLPDLDLPLGNSDDGRLVGRAGLQARNFWELGPLESAFGARTDPYVRTGFDVEPRSDPPVAAVSYAHHPPLQTFIAAAAVGILGDNLAALRIAAFCIGLGHDRLHGRAAAGLRPSLVTHPARCGRHGLHGLVLCLRA